MASRRREYRVGVFEAKTHLSDLLRRVEGGAIVIIERRGQAIAELRRPEPLEQPPGSSLAEAWRSLRSRIASPPASTDEIRELIDEGRRW
jgi:antitoxin (DNA-binding transcriptional repressor) of toxin-antitoxin stability system